MDRQRFLEAERLFHEVMELAPPLRAAFIEHAARGDAELVEQVMRLVGYAEGESATIQILEGVDAIVSKPHAGYRLRWADRAPAAEQLHRR